MKPQDVLRALVDAGVVLWVDGGRLRFRAATGVVDHATRAQVPSCRVAIVALMRAGAVLPVRVADWPIGHRDDFEERAGILEFDGGLARTAAEIEAERLVRSAFTRAFVQQVLPRSSP